MNRRKLMRDKSVWTGEFSNGDGKKQCYLMTKHIKGVSSKDEGHPPPPQWIGNLWNVLLEKGSKI